MFSLISRKLEIEQTRTSKVGVADRTLLDEVMILTSLCRLVGAEIWILCEGVWHKAKEVIINLRVHHDIILLKPHVTRLRVMKKHTTIKLVEALIPSNRVVVTMNQSATRTNRRA